MRLSKFCTALFSAAAFCAAIPLMQAQAADQEVHQSGPYTYEFYDYGYDVEMDNTLSENVRFSLLFRQYNAPGFPSRIAFGCSIFRPSSNPLICCGVSSFASISLRGH